MPHNISWEKSGIYIELYGNAYGEELNVNNFPIKHYWNYVL